MDDYATCPTTTTRSNDNGGVHINSGIPNHAFYLAATALGGNAWEKAGRIWYVTLTERTEPRARSSPTAAQATVEASRASSSARGDEQRAVEDAWAAGGRAASVRHDEALDRPRRGLAGVRDAARS